MDSRRTVSTNERQVSMRSTESSLRVSTLKQLMERKIRQFAIDYTRQLGDETGVQNILSPGKSNFCNTSSISPLKLEKVLVVSKLSRYEYEKSRHRHLSEVELETHLRSRGTDYDLLLYHHNLHKTFETSVVKAIKKFGIDVKVVNRFGYLDKLIEWADVILPTGGDGTFLLAASKIRDNQKPIIGLNSDPTRSEGYLCLPKQYSDRIQDVITKLQKGEFKWLMRSRIRITLQGQKGEFVSKNMHCADKIDDGSECKFFNIKLANNEDSKILPSLALNEVFIGETISARVSYLEMWLNNEPEQTYMKCSGVCLATGTGSTAWHRSINRIPVQTVGELLRLLDIEPTEGKDSLATVLANIYNKDLIFDPDEKKISYTIRDLISAGVWPQPKGIKSRGFASRIKVKSHCYDATLVVDGGIAYPFNDGMEAVLEIHPDDALRTVTLSE